jgi:tetratricopeptide (TPR) repeat protein
MQRALTLPPDHPGQELEQAARALRAIGSTLSLTFLYSNAAYNALKAGHPEQARPLLDRADPLARQLDHPTALIFVCGNRGLEALFNGDLERALDAFTEQLRLCQERVISQTAAEGLAGLAAIASRRGDPEHAALLLGAATVQGAIADADVTAQLERRFFAPARSAYGERHWSEAQAEGARLNFEQALTLALSPGPAPR